MTSAPLSVAFLSLSILGCGSEGTDPTLLRPGFVVSVSVPGLIDTTVTGDSTNWRLFGPAQEPGHPEPYQVTLQWRVLDPPPPLESPLIFQVIWHLADPDLNRGTYTFGPTKYEVSTQVNSNLGTWGASQGEVKLTEVSDTMLVGTLSALMVPIWPPDSPLPDITVQASFWSPRVPTSP